MPGKTNAPYGDKTNAVQQSVGLFAKSLRRKSLINNMVGKMQNGESGAASQIKNESSKHMPILRVTDLGKRKGDEVTYNLIQPVNAYPIMGSEYAEGRGTGMSIVEDRLRVDQARFPIDLGNVMTSIRSPVDFRRIGKPIAQDLMDRYSDLSTLVHLCGARGFQNSAEWAVPLTSHPKFKQIMVNDVKAPTKNRHFIVAGDAVQPFTVNAGEVDFATTDLFTMDTVDSMRSVMDDMVLPPPCIQVEGDEAATDEPLRLWIVSPAQYRWFAKQQGFRTLISNAVARSSNAKNHPLFRGEVGLWNNFLIRKMSHAIRFNPGDPIRYSTSYTSESEANALVPALGAGYAVDRSIILGGQALAEAFAAHKGTGVSYFWSEKELDHGDKAELLVGAIRGVKKIRFNVDVNGDGSEFQYTDHGIVTVDTVVKLQGS